MRRSSMVKFISLIVAWIVFITPDNAIAATGQVALTFDDLPALTILPDQKYVDYLNLMIVRTLRRHHAPAIGFVNEGKIDELIRDRQIANLERWLHSGMDLGNHTYSHPSLNEIGADAYIADIANGERLTRTILQRSGRQLQFFRPPYLETGRTLAIRTKVEAWLAAHGYRMAPVTIDADDWEFAEPYDDAISRKDRTKQREIRAEYLAYTATRVKWAQASARKLFGRDIAHVMLLHCTRLNADTLGDILKILRRAHLKPVSLATALEDPVYRQPDTYIGGDGIDWLERWAATRKLDLPDAGNDDPPADIQTAYDLVDNDRH